MTKLLEPTAEPQMERNTWTQFVCFETPLPALVFTSLWKPFAASYIAQGLHRVVLAERTHEILGGLSFKFISRNLWPADAFTQALRGGRIGEGGGGPVHALQGGTFRTSRDHNAEPDDDAHKWASKSVLGSGGEDRPKIMGLFKLRDAVNLAEVSSALTAAFSRNQGMALFLHQEPAVTKEPAVTTRQRFDLIVEIYCPQGQQKEAAARLETLTSAAADAKVSSLGIYQEILVLPAPAKAEKEKNKGAEL